MLSRPSGQSTISLGRLNGLSEQEVALPIWRLHDEAKNRLSEVVDLSLSQGPQCGRALRRGDRGAQAIANDRQPETTRDLAL